jgi:hypothetical protein
LEARECTAAIGAGYSACHANVRMPDDGVRIPDMTIATVAELGHAAAFVRDAVPAVEVS